MNYTIQLRDIVNLGIELPLNSYPIFDESHREELNKKIVMNYWNRDIAHETVQLFCNRLENKLNLIMPKYNLLYKSAKLLDSFDLFNGITESERSGETVGENSENQAGENSLESTGKRDTTSEDSGKNSSDVKAEALTSEYPQTGFNGDGVGYASAGNKTNTETVGTSTTSSKAREQDETNQQTNFTSKSNGKSKASTLEKATVKTRNGTVADLVESYREAIINIDEMIVKELEPLFLGVWGSPQPLYPQPQHTFGNYHFLQGRLF